MVELLPSERVDVEFRLSGDPFPVSVHEAVCMTVGAVDEPGIDPAPYEARRKVDFSRTRGHSANSLALRADLFPADVQ